MGEVELDDPPTGGGASRVAPVIPGGAQARPRFQPADRARAGHRAVSHFFVELCPFEGCHPIGHAQETADLLEPSLAQPNREADEVVEALEAWRLDVQQDAPEELRPPSAPQLPPRQAPSLARVREHRARHHSCAETAPQPAPPRRSRTAQRARVHAGTRRAARQAKQHQRHSSRGAIVARIGAQVARLWRSTGARMGSRARSTCHCATMWRNGGAIVAHSNRDSPPSAL